MGYPKIIFLIVWLAVSPKLFAQACTNLGQTPATAFPVCAATTFEQKSVPVCSSNSLFVPGCSDKPGSANYENRNPFWYKFKCYRSGSLGFTINPKNQGDDYDWQLYDITGLDPNEVFTNRNIIVTGNWAGTPGNTGTSINGVPYINCASYPPDKEPTFARMPNLIEGHEYILLVSHYDGDTQSGYDLTFSGGTAVITDPEQPVLKSLSYPCDASRIFLKINKRILQSSVAKDGSDFSFSDPNIRIVGAESVGTGFDADSIILMLDAPMLPGSYTVTMREGKDGNTLIDNCGNYIPEGDQLTMTITLPEPTAMGKLATLSCAPEELQLTFDKKINVQSVSADGSDFAIMGPVPVSIQNIRFDENTDHLSSNIYLKLAEPLVHGGTYQIELKQGTDGNTVIDECALETLPEIVSFSIKDTVNADFTYSLTTDCDKASIRFQHDGRHEVNSWSWQFAKEQNASTQNAHINFTPPYGDKDITLWVSNGFCSDSASQVIPLGPTLKAAFRLNPIICPDDSVQVINTSTGNIQSWSWNFGDGTGSSAEEPQPKSFTQALQEKDYQVTLTVTSDKGCMSTAIQHVKVLVTCRIDVPNSFTPNGDGINDFFSPLNAFLADGMVFRVYNRYGQMVFESTDWTQKWDGNFNGDPQSSGVYAWTLKYINKITGESVFRKGSVTLIR